MGSIFAGPPDLTPELLVEFADVLLFNLVLPLLAGLVVVQLIKIAHYLHCLRRAQRARQRQAQFDADLHLRWEEEKIAVREYLEQQLREAHQAQERG